MPRIHVFGGGTVFHVRPHLAIAAQAYGQTARDLAEMYDQHPSNRDGVFLPPPRLRAVRHLTKMAGGTELETNEDVARRVEEVVADPETRIVIFSVALCDWEGRVVEPVADGLRAVSAQPTPSGKDQPRLRSRGFAPTIELSPADKIISTIRKDRKDIFLVGFKTTAGATPDDQYLAGLDLLKKSSCNLVLANDVHTRLNIVITPEQARYHETTDRKEALKGLLEMTLLRSKGTFTRSTVIPGEPVKWQSDMVPDSLRTVVDHCISRGAYKPFNGATVGHFAYKIDDTRFVTSKRKVDFNKLADEGMVLVEAKGDDHVVAHGHKPSVGGQSQRIIFREHPGVDCIVHAHVPLRKDAPAQIPVREQRPHECGSHECGKNTSDGLIEFEDGIKAVMLDHHGPNIVFPKDADPAKVINFIERNFDLEGRTDNVVAA